MDIQIIRFFEVERRNLPTPNNCFGWNIILVSLGFSNKMVYAILIAAAFQIILGLYGFMLNSFSDIEQDKITKKNLAFRSFPKNLAIIFLFLLALTTLVFPGFFSTASALVGLTGFLLATAYSIRPIRLKERGIIGIIVSSLSQAAIPFLFLTSITEMNLLAIYFTIWLFLRMGLAEIDHHEISYKADKKSKTKSIVVLLGQEKTNKYTKIFYVLFVAWTLFPLTWLSVYGFFVAFTLTLFMIYEIKRYSIRFENLFKL